MRNRAFLSIIIIAIVLVGLPTTCYSGSEDVPNVILVTTDGNSDINAFQLVDLSNTLRKPIVLCTAEPREVEVAYDVSACTLDFRDGTLTEEFVETIYETQYVNEFTVIIGNKIWTHIYRSATADNKAFSTDFQNELVKLQDIDSQAWRTNTLAQYDGDGNAFDGHWEWELTDTVEISSLDDGDDWTYEYSYAWDLWRSVPDIYIYKRYWLFEWVVMTKIDSGDYSNDIWFKWCGPWIHERWIKNSPKSYGSTNEELWDWGPTTSVGSWSYDISSKIQATPTGPQVEIGASKSWSGTDVTITDQSTKANDFTEWYETFVGADYLLWPVLYEPCSASHNTYNSWRCSEWRYTSSDTNFETKLKTKTTVKWDDGFYWVIFPFVIGYYRYTTWTPTTNYVTKP